MWMPEPCIDKNEGDSCDLGTACSVNTCQSGVCTPVSQVTCDQCFECDPIYGCVVAQGEGLSCSDDDPCTDLDTCQSGVCVGTAVTCVVPDGCYNSTCSADTGKCVDECYVPVAAPAESPVQSPIDSPASSPVSTPVTAPVESPVESPADSPMSTPSVTPDASETPAANPVATPIKVRPLRVASGSNQLAISIASLILVAAFC